MHLSGFGGPFEVACKYLKVRDLEGAATPKEGYIQEEIARSLARERELWQREREAHAIAIERERDRLKVKICLLHGCIGVLISEMRGYRMPVPLVPYILGRDPPIH